MKKSARRKSDLSYLKLFKQSLALSFSLFVFGSQSSYATTITGDSAFNTTVNTVGNTTNIQNGISGGNSTNILHFYDFNLSQGDIANFILGYGVDKYVSLVDKQIIINGILNSVKNGSIGGDVLFVSPEGMLVGTSGVMNMGSLQLITPSQTSYNTVVAKGAATRVADINRLKSDSTSSETEIYGKIFSAGAVNLADANKITLGANSDIVSGFNASGFVKTRYGDLTGIVNSEGIVDAGYMSGTSGNVQIVAKNIASEDLFAREGLIQSTGNVTINTPSTTGTEISLTSKVQAGGNVTIGNLNETSPTESTTNVDIYNAINSGKNISINADTAYIGEDANLSATSSGGTVESNSRINLSLNSNVSADAGVTINSQANFEQGANSKITNLTSGNINIKSVNTTQETGAAIVNEGTGHVTIDSPGFVSLQNIMAQKGNIDISTARLTLNDTVSSSGDINIKASQLEQSADDFTSLDAGNNIIINTTTGNIGTASQSINMSADGSVSLDAMAKGSAYIHGTGDNDLTIANGTNLLSLDASSDKGINVTGNISSNRNVNLDATTGINQNTNTTISSRTGNVNLTNSTSGNIDTATITASGESINITNNATDGSVNINNNLTSNNSIVINSNGGIVQASGANVTKNGTGNINIQNTVSGDINLNAITAAQGNIIVENQSADGGIVLNNVLNAQNGQINLTANNDVTQTSTGITLQSLRDINISSVLGNVGSNDQRVVVSTDGSVIVNAGSGANIQGEDTNIDLSNITAGTNYNLGTTGEGEIIIGGAFNNANGSIEIETEKALTITDDITAVGDITLTSGNGIVQNEGTNIESGLGTALSGDISVTNNGEGGIILNSVTANKGGITLINSETSSGNINAGGLSAEGGDISITNVALNGDILLNNIISTDSNIELAANGNILQNETLSGTVLNAQNNIDITSQNGSIGANNNSVSLSAGNIVNAAGSDIYLKSIDSDLTTGVISAENTVNLVTDFSSGVQKDITLTDMVSGTDIYINASGSILQNTTDPLSKTIDAQGDLFLNANGADIGNVSDEGIKAIGFSAKGNLSALVGNGSVALNGIDTSIDTASINASQNLDLITTNSGKITVSNEQNTTGHINLNSAENIELNKSLSASENITLTAKGDITQGADITGTALSSQKDINITASNAGTTDKSIIVNAQGVVNAGTEDLHAGNLYIEDNTGDFTIGQMFADNNLSLKAQGNIIQADGSVAGITSTGNVNVNSESGNIGASDASLKLNVTGENSSFNVEKSQNVYIDSPDSDLTTGNINAVNTVNISTTGSGNINLKGLIKSNDVNLHAVDNIIQDINTKTKTIEASNNLNLISDTGNVGATGEIGSAILFSTGGTGSLSADAQQGSVYLNGIDTDINTGTIKALNDIDLTTTNSGNITVSDNLSAKGHITLNSAEALTLDKNLTADDYINLTSNGGDINLNAIIDAKTDIILTANGNIAQDASNNSIVLNAGNDMLLDARGSIGSDSKSLQLNANGTVHATAGDSAVPVPGSVYIESQNKSLNTGTISAVDTVKISATGNNSDINLTNKVSGTNIDIQAGASIIQNLAAEASDRSIEAAGDLNLVAGSGNIGQTGNAVDFSANGNLSASAANGSVVLNGIDTNINTNSITALNDIDLSTQNTGTITVSDNIITNDGYIRLDSADSLEINKNLLAGKYVQLGANGGIIQDEATFITGGTNASSTAADGYISIINKNGGDVVLKNVAAKGEINITNEALPSGTAPTNGDVTLGTITSASESVSVYNNIVGGDIILESLISSTKDIALSTDASIVQTGSGLALDAGNDIILAAGGDIGSDANSLILNAENTVAADGDNIYLQSTNKDLNISAINSNKETADGTIKLTTTETGNIKFLGLVKGGDVTVDAAQGILQDASVEKAIDASSDLTLNAHSGSIGSKDDTQGGALKISSGGNLSAEADSAVVLNGIDTDITTSSISAGTDIDLKTTIDKDDTKGNIIVNNTLNATNGYVSLDSAKGLEIEQNITAADYVKLNTQDGNLNINSAVISDTYIEINANGDIVQTGGSLTAGGQNLSGMGIGIAASGDITLGDINSQDGKITIENSTADKNIILSGLIDSTTSDIEINSLGNISQTTTDTALSTNKNVILNTQGNIGNDANSMVVSANGTITADGNDVYIGSKDKNLNIAGINSAKTDANGIVKLNTETGNIHLAGIVKGGSITMDSALDISQDAGLAKSIDGENISLTSRGGGIGSDGNSIDLSVKDTGKVDASSAGDVYLNSPDGNLTTGAITANNHKVDINSSAALHLDGLISAQDVILKAVDNITQNAALEKSIDALNVDLTSTTGSIGEAALGENPANAIDFSATGTLNASATNLDNGSIVLNGVNTSITTDSISAGKNIDLSTTGAGHNITVANPLSAGGYISLNSADSLVLNGNLDAIDFVSLAAQTDILLNYIITAGTDITVEAAGNITQAQSSSSTVLDAGRDITLTAGNDIGLSTKSVLINANGTVDAQGQNIYLDSPNKDLSLSSINSTNNGSVNLSTTGTGKIHFASLVKGGDVKINSAEGITQDSTLDKSIEAQGSLVLNAADGNIGEAKQGSTEANAIDFSASSIEAHADNGSVVLNGVESDINTSSVTALNNIDLTTTTSGKITVSSALETTNGYINLNSAENLILNENITSQNSSVSLGSQNGDITLNSIVTAGTELNLDASGNIIQQTVDTSLNAGQDINISSLGSAGSADASIIVNAGNKVNANAQNVYLEDNTGDFTIGEVTADNYVKLSSSGGLIQAETDKIGVTAGGSADLISINGDIGSASQALNTAVSGLVNAQAENGSAYFASNNDFNSGNITVQNIAQINSGSDITLNGLIKANETNLTAQNNISQTTDNKAIEATGGNINLVSNQGNIGTPNGNAIGFSLMGTGVINADASTNGSVVLKGIDSSINTNTIKAQNDIDLTTTGTGNITVSDNLDAGGYIKLDSANTLTLDKNLTADENIDLFARNGDIIINSILNSGTDMSLDATGSVSQTIGETALIASNDISINAGADIGSSANSILLNSGGTVLADGANIYLSSPNADLTAGTVNASGVVNLNTSGTGSITTNENIVGSEVNIDSAQNVSVNQNITAQNGLVINAQNEIQQSSDSTISSDLGNISVIANNGDLNLSGNISNSNGSVSIVNETTGNAELNVNSIYAGTNFNIRHEGNGILNVNGAVNNNGTSSILSNSTGDDAGLALNGTINNNHGSLNVESFGQKGTQITGVINNNILDETAGVHSDITVQNNNGELNVISSKIDNGKNNSSQNALTFINNGTGGLNINSDITNNGILNVTNNAGEMSISGELKAELGSQNNFTNGSDNDFLINSIVTNKGTELSFNNTGTGSLILGQNAFITIYSVLDNTNIYTGKLNINNSGSSGNIQIDGQIIGLDGAPLGQINIENSASGANSGVIFGNTASIDAKNNSVVIANKGNGGIQTAESVNINSSSDVSIANSNTGSITFGNSAQISGSTINIENSASDGDVSFGDDYTLSSSGDMNIKSAGANGVKFGTNANLSAQELNITNTGSTGGVGFGADATVTALQDLTINNSGANGISLGDNATLSSVADLTIENSGDNGISLGDNANLSGQGVNITNTGSTGGVGFGTDAIVAAVQDLTINNSGTNGISLGDNANLSGQGVNITNTGSTGGIGFGADATVTASQDLTINNSGANGIILGDNATLSSVANLTIENSGDNGISLGDNANLSGQGVNITNTGSTGGIGFGTDAIVAAVQDLTINNSGDNGISFENNANITGVKIAFDNTNLNSGVKFDNNVNINASQDLTVNNAGNEGISFGNDSILTTDNDLTLQNTNINAGVQIGNSSVMEASGNILINNNGSHGISVGDNSALSADENVTINEVNGNILFGASAELTGSNVTIENTGTNGGIQFGNTADINAYQNLSVTNSGASGITYGDNSSLIAGSSLSLENTNGDVTFGNMSVLQAGNSLDISQTNGNLGFGSDVELSSENAMNISKTGMLNGISFDNKAILTSNAGMTLQNEGSEGITFGNNASLSSVADLTIENSGDNGISLGDNANLSGQGVNITNTGSTGGIGFGADATVTALQDLTIDNSGANGIILGNNASLSSVADLTIENSGDDGISLGDNAVLDSKAAMSLQNQGGEGITFGNNANLSSASDMTLNNSGANGISFNNNASVAGKGKFNATNTGANGITFGANSNISAESDLILDNSGADGITIDNNTNISSNDTLTLKNTGISGITVNGTAKGNDIYVDNKNSNVNIAHNNQNGNLIADNIMSVIIENGSLINTSTSPENADNLGLVSGSNMDLNVTGGSIGTLDSTLNSIIQNGFVLDANNSIHISSDATVNASADNDINIKSLNKNLNIGTLFGKDVLLSSLNGAINTNSAVVNNIYAQANGNNGSINLQNLTSTGKLVTESDFDTTIKSNSNLNAESMLSKNGSINIGSEGSTYINEIAAANDISITVEDETLTINDLGRVDRDKTVIPKTVNLTVKDAKRPHSGSEYRPGMSYDEINTVTPNSKLDIYNAYVQDKVTMKADTITAQVYDISNSAVQGQKRVDANGKEATGFHNANTEGKLLEFDIQGANFEQSDVGSDPANPYYTPDANDKHSLNVHLTIGDSVNGAELGANFKKLYSDYTFIDTVISDPSVYSTLSFDSVIIGEKAIFRNNKFRVDVNNTSISQNYPINKHYNDSVDAVIDNQTSFNLKMSDKIEIDVNPVPPTPGKITEHNDPNKIVRIPTIDSLTKEPSAKDDNNSAVNSDKSTALKNISWVFRNTDNDIVGASEQIHDPIVKTLVAISEKGVLVVADTNQPNGLKKGDVLHIQMKKDDASFNIDGKVDNINGSLVEINFVNIDKLTQNVMKFWCMEQENL